MWYYIGAAQKEHGSYCKGEQGGRAPIVVPHKEPHRRYMGRIVKRNREARPQLWCQIGAAQKEHGSHCKEEQGGRAPIVVPHKEYTHTHPLDRNGLLGLQIHITCTGPGTNHGPRSGSVGDVKAVWGRVQGPDLAGRNGCDRCDRAQQQIIQLIYAKQIRPPPLTIQLSV
jgi:hypothetical protein